MSVDLRTKYLGFELKNPIVAAPTPMTGKVEKVSELEEAGVSMIVLPSLFEEQITHDEMEEAKFQDMGGGFAEAMDFFPQMETYNTGPQAYLDNLGAIKKAVRIPVFGSLNGHTKGGWVRYAKLIQDAGADGLELNIYDVPTDAAMSPAEVEARYLELISAVKEALTIPLAVKIGPYFSSLVNVASQMKEAGADGLVIFNRFMQPDIDLESLKIHPDIELSTSSELRLPLRWIGILKGRVEMGLSATCGVHCAEDVIKMILAGADITEMASAFLRRGTSYPAVVLAGLTEWMEKHEYESIEQMKGAMSQLNSADPEQFERVNYMRALVTFSNAFH